MREPRNEPEKLGAEGPHGRYHADSLDVFHTIAWLRVLASRSLYAELRRPVPAAHLAALLEVFVAYAARGSWYTDEDFEPVPIDRREPLARELLALLRAWTPPGLPDAIRQVARALLHAEGHEEPAGGWDGERHEDDVPLADLLLWPEGVPAKAPTPAAPAMTVAEFLGPKAERAPDDGKIEIFSVGRWNGGLLVGQTVTPAPDGTLPEGAELPEVHGAINWLMVLAAPPLFRTLRRAPERAHLLHLLDVYIAYAARGLHFTACKRARKRRLREREGLARALREVMVAWTPPDLPPALTAEAREVLEAEGHRPPAGGWDRLAHELPCPLEDVMLWPEGTPWVMRARTGGPERTLR